MNFVPIIRPEKHKTSASIMGACGHHLRTIPTQNADPGRTPDNEIYVGGTPKQIAKTVMDRTKDLVKRKDANRAIELFLGASNDYWDSGPADHVALAMAYQSFLEKEFGPQHVVGFGLHLDEKHPHFWAMITPITPDGRLSSAHWFDGPAKLSGMLDRLTEQLKPLGFERGKRGVKANHIEVDLWHQAQAGNKKAEKTIADELTKREETALKRAAAAEAKAKKVEVILEQVKAEAIKVSGDATAKLEELKKREVLLKKQEENSVIYAQKLDEKESFLRRFASDLQLQKTKLMEAFATLPGALQEKLMSIFKPRPTEPVQPVLAPEVPSSPEKRPARPLDGSAGHFKP